MKQKKKVPPHIFAVADDIYHSVVDCKRPQCCIISGESGAGKTESSKFIIQHLLTLTTSVEKELNLKIEQVLCHMYIVTFHYSQVVLLLKVSPLLEAFGNAQTVMNNNSSRFGKYLELVFTEEGVILGGRRSQQLL